MDSIIVKKPLNRKAENNQFAVEDDALIKDQKKLHIKELKEALNNALDMVEGKKPRKTLKEILNG